MIKKLKSFLPVKWLLDFWEDLKIENYIKRWRDKGLWIKLINDYNN